MAIGFINATTSGNGNLSYYLRENECTRFLHSGGNMSKTEVLNTWKTIEENEKLGNKELGIRGRHDAQVRKNYVLTMPNSLNDKECTERVKKVIDQTPIKNCTYTICVHKGEKDGIVNKHVHLIVNERNLETMKKDRDMIKKAFLVKEFRPAYEQEFKYEFSQGKELLRRERIKTALYQSDKEFSRETVKEFEQVAQRELVQQKSGYLDTFMALGQAMKDRQEKEQREEREKEQEKKQEKERQEQKEQSQEKQKNRGMNLGFGR